MNVGADIGTVTYTVRCELADPTVAAKWIAWMRDGHLGDVIAAGALGAELVQLDSESPIVCEIRYHFASWTALEAYQRDHGPRLRAEALARFPLELGLHYTRSTGEVLASQ